MIRYKFTEEEREEVLRSELKNLPLDDLLDMLPKEVYKSWVESLIDEIITEEYWRRDKHFANSITSMDRW